MASTKMPPMSLSEAYAKFDAIADSDEGSDDDARDPDAWREALREETELALMRTAPGLADDASVVAGFVAAQRRDEGATDNRTRHREIIDVLSSRWDVLGAPRTARAISRLAKDASLRKSDGDATRGGACGGRVDVSMSRRSPLWPIPLDRGRRPRFRRWKKRWTP